MRITHVIASVAPRLGGPSRAVVEMSAALAKRGHQVSVITTTLAFTGTWGVARDNDVARDLPIGVPLSHRGFDITYFHPTWPTRWAYSRALARHLRSAVLRADVLHIHSLYLFTTLVASRIAAAAGVPYIVRPHGTLAPYIRRRGRLAKSLYHLLIEDHTFRRAAGVHYTTETEREHVLDRIAARVRSFVVPLGVELPPAPTAFDRAVSRQRLGVHENDFVWLFLGRLNHAKGLDLLGPAFARIAAAHPRSVLLLGGPDDAHFAQQLIADAAQYDVQAQVRILGLLHDEAMREALCAANAWVLPSYSESFGLGVVEAMAMGVPVVISDQVSIAETVRRAGAGLVVHTEANALRVAMEAMMSLSSAERAQMGQNGRALCEQVFSWDRVAVELEHMYEAVISGEGEKNE